MCYCSCHRRTFHQRPASWGIVGSIFENNTSFSVIFAVHTQLSKSCLNGHCQVILHRWWKNYLELLYWRAMSTDQFQSERKTAKSYYQFARPSNSQDAHAKNVFTGGLFSEHGHYASFKVILKERVYFFPLLLVCFSGRNRPWGASLEWSVRKLSSGMCAVCLLHTPSQLAFKMHSGYKLNLNEPLYSGV